MTNLWTFQLLGTFYSNTKFGSQICHPVVWIVLHSPKFVNPDFQSWQPTLLNSEYANIHLVFLRILFRGRVLVFRNGTFTWDTVLRDCIYVAVERAMLWMEMEEPAPYIQCEGRLKEAASVSTLLLPSPWRLPLWVGDWEHDWLSR